MIETFKILTGKYDMRATPTMLGAKFFCNKGHNLRLNKFRVKYDLRRKYYTLLVELLMYEMVYLVLLSLQIL